MQINTDGLLVLEKPMPENDKLITILTREYGIIRAFARGVKNVKNKNFSATQQFCYSDFVIFRGRDKCIINEASARKSFWGVRSDIEKLALAQYFCDLILNLVAEGQRHTEDILRLCLNSLHYLSEGKISDKLLKSVFEMRLLAMSGYMPNLVTCAHCEGADSRDFYFVPDANGIICSGCIGNYNFAKFKLTDSVLHALRHTVYSEFNKMFAFELATQSQIELSAMTEAYLLRCLEKNLKTLDFYNKLVVN